VVVFIGILREFSVEYNEVFPLTYTLTEVL